MTDFFDDFPLDSDSEESPFARNVNGYLVRLDPPTAEQYREVVVLHIDGQRVEFPKAVPLTDAQGAHVYRDGQTIPRASTIYDAAAAHFRDRNPIPILCHRPHMNPVAVCRVCSVYVIKATDKRPPRKLFPACQHRIEQDMKILTRQSTEPIAWGKGTKPAGEIVADIVRTLLELLVTDHLPSYADNGGPPHNELAQLARTLSVPRPRFPLPSVRHPGDSSSPVIAVDPTACILCDRCVRGCNEVRQNFVIGRNGKGYPTRIGFDLGGPMGESSCVECGECMISCPTEALTVKQTVQAPPRQAAGTVLGSVAVDDLHGGPLGELFGGIPRKFFEWNVNAVVRRRLAPNERLIREGDYGSHAFLLEDGSLVCEVKAPLLHLRNEQPTSWWSRMRGHSALRLQSIVEGEASSRRDLSRSIRTDVGGLSVTGERPQTELVARRDRPNLRLIGETACLNNYPYGTTVTAIEESFVLEIRRNVLLQMLRVPETRERLNEVFRQDALEPYLLRLPLFSVLGVSDRQRLSRQVASQIRFVRADPGQIISAQNGPASCCYLVRVGFVRVSQEQAGQEVVLDYVGPGGFFGDEELMESTDGPPPLRQHLPRALDHVELIEVPRQAIVQVLNDPQVRDRLRTVAQSRQRRYELQMARTERPLESYLDQGLYHARSLLVLDLDKCTRCDECTKACADTHNGVTRLIREGLRFENFLVATSCRSCLDPTCLIGCPVDAIHRRKRREISIEAWCIGCGLCARSCPYGNIHMAPFADGSRAEPAFKATTCDLCQDLSPQADPSCVYACPHDAAHRMNGRELLKDVEAKRAKKEV